MGAAAGSIAWACTADAIIVLLDENGADLEPEQVVAGDALIVEGRQWREGETVEIYLDSAEGPLLGLPKGSYFKTTVRIPASAEEGVHVVYARTVDEEGAYRYSARATLRVLPRPAQEAETSGAGSPPGGPASTVRTAHGGAFEPGSPNSDAVASQPSESSPVADALAAPSDVEPGFEQRQPGTARGGRVSSPSASEAGATSDLAAGLDRWRGPSLAHGLTDTRPADRPGPGAAAGVALLVAGLTLTLAGTLGAAVNARRARA